MLSPLNKQQGVVDMKKSGTVAALALAAMVTAHPAHACWTSAEADAAKVSNLNMMMMVSALRCRNGADNFLKEYNHFVKQNNPVLGAQNTVLKAHFARINGANNAEAATDKFVITMANHYGGGHASMGCDDLKNLAQDLSRRSYVASSLVSFADVNVEDLPLPGGLCPVNFAAK
jgi:phage terminase large subunit-like protein